MLAQMPTRNGRTVLFMNQRGYSDADISEPLEAALKASPQGVLLDPATICAEGTPTAQIDPSACAVGNSTAYIFGDPGTGGQSGKILLGKHVRTQEQGTCVWSIVHHNASCCGNMSCGLPQYIDPLTHEPIRPADAPATLVRASMPTTPKSGPYDGESIA